MKFLRPVLFAVASFALVCAATAYRAASRVEPVSPVQEEVLPVVVETETVAEPEPAPSPADLAKFAERHLQTVREMTLEMKASAKREIPPEPRLAVVIDDCGHNVSIARKILSLGLTATWAIIPESRHSREVAELAADHGQPFLMHVPMQAMVDETGKSGYVIGVDTSEEKIAAYLGMLRSKFPEAVGVNNHRGSKATSDRPTMQRFMKAFATTGWGFLDSRTTGKTIANKVAMEYDIPVVQNSVFIDGSSDLVTMKKQFARALSTAKKRGNAVAICHAREKTLPFLVYLSENSFEPVSFVTVDELWKARRTRK